MTWSDDLAGQLEFYWQFHLWPRLQGLTDAEYLWQPVGGMWSVRADSAGVVQPDGALAEPPTPPVTTIAWRLDHLTRGVMGTRGRSLFGGSPLGETEQADMYDARHWPEPIPLDAAGALERLEQSYTQWSAGVRGLDDAAMQRSLGPRGGQYADDSYGQLVLHINREVMAHGAEICLLRDLFRAESNDRDPLIAAVLAGDTEAVVAAGVDGERPGLAAEAAARGHWAVVRALVEGGVSADGALHFAAAAGQDELSDWLVDKGASLDALDANYHLTPSGWADFFDHAELAERLRPGHA